MIWEIILKNLTKIYYFNIFLNKNIFKNNQNSDTTDAIRAPRGNTTSM